jgi:multicomponent Na+:H+ antiporter subunit D
MAIYGVVYAVLENDMRRLLAYHIISQVGYMVAGVGIGTPLALNGAAAHAFAHILYKGLLFMGAGAVIEMTGKRRLTELGGLYRTMPLTLSLYMIGGLSISAFPLFSGFVSKSMVIAAAAEDHRVAIWLMLTLASAGTFLHTGLKLPYYVFFAKDAGLRPQEPPRNMLLAMALAAALCLGIGVFPAALYALLPAPVTFAPYTADHVVTTLEILLFTGLGFWLLRPQLDPERTLSLDTDWLYRQAGRGLLWLARHPVASADARLSNAYATVILKWSEKLAQCFWIVEQRVIDGAVNGVAAVTYAAGLRLRQLQTGQLQHYVLVMVIGLLVILSVYLLV